MSDKREVRAWDLVTRCFHWLLVLAIVSAWLSAEFATELGDTDMRWHRYNGYWIFSLVFTRVIWGWMGSSTSRFGFFLRAPGQAWAYLRSLRQTAALPYLSHNPAGGWMVVVLLCVIMVQSLLGLFASDELFVFGPLASLVSEEKSQTLTGLHETLFKVLLALVAIHVAAVLFHQRYKGEALIKAMFSGQKDGSEFADRAGGQPLYWGSTWRAALVLLLVLLLGVGLLEGVA